MGAVLDRHTAEQLVRDMFTVVTHGDPQLAVRCIHPEFVNEESVNEPNDDYVASIGSSAGLELSPGRHNQRHLRQPV